VAPVAVIAKKKQLFLLLEKRKYAGGDVFFLLPLVPLPVPWFPHKF
jgi:hypothetical protein